MDSRIQVLDPGFVFSGTWIPDFIVSGFPDSLGWIPVSKPRIPESNRKRFPDSWIQIIVNPLLSSPRGAYLFQAHLRESLIETGGLFNLQTTMVSVLHKELEYKMEKLKHKKVGGHAAEDQNQIRTSSW